jgi:hypothetical protein
MDEKRTFRKSKENKERLNMDKTFMKNEIRKMIYNKVCDAYNCSDENDNQYPKCELIGGPCVAFDIDGLVEDLLDLFEME